MVSKSTTATTTAIARRGAGRAVLLAMTSALALIAGAAPSRAGDFSFSGGYSNVPAYGTHPVGGINGCNCGQGVPDTVDVTLSGDIFSSASYTNGQAPSAGDNVDIEGLPDGSFPAVQGPANYGNVNGLDPIYGQVAPSYSGSGGFHAFGSGQLAGLTIEGPGELDPGAITVSGTARISGVGDAVVLGTRLVDTHGETYDTGQRAKGIVTISGGALEAGTLQLIGDTADPAFAGGVEIKGGATLTGDAVVQVFSDNGSDIDLSGKSSLISKGKLNFMVQPVTFQPATKVLGLINVNDSTLSAVTINIGAFNPDLGEPQAPDGSRVVVNAMGGAIKASDGLFVGSDVSGGLYATSGAKIDVKGRVTIANYQATTTTASQIDLAGAGTTLTVGERLYVGANAAGSLTVDDKAAVTIKDILVVGLNPGSSGTMLVLNGATVVSDDPQGANALSGDIADQPGSKGKVTLSGDGSSWDAKTSLAVGYGGSGELDIEEGATLKVEGALLRVGRNAGSDGLLILTGEGSTIDAKATTLYVGFGGKGRVDLNGGTVTDLGGVDIGGLAGSDGSLSISGANAALTVAPPSGTSDPADVVVGHAGDGRLTVAAGAKLDLTDAYTIIGQSGGSSGTMTIDASVAAASVKFGLLAIGFAGKGALNIFGAGSGDTSVVEFTQNVQIGEIVGSDGTLSISQATVDIGDSQSNPNKLGQASITLGEAGKGTIAVGEGGTLRAAALNLGDGIGTGAITLSAASSMAEVSGLTQVGAGDKGHGELTLASGSTFTTQSLDVAAVDGAFGAVRDNGGTITVKDAVKVGQAGADSLATVVLNSASKMTAQDVTVAGEDAAILNVLGGSSLTFKTLNVDGKGAVLFDQSTATGTNGLGNWFFGKPDIGVHGGTLTAQNGATITAGLLALDGDGQVTLKDSATTVHLGALSLDNTDGGEGPSLTVDAVLTVDSSITVNGGAATFGDRGASPLSHATAAQLIVNGGEAVIDGGQLTLNGGGFFAGPALQVGPDGALTGDNGGRLYVSGGYEDHSLTSSLRAGSVLDVTGNVDLYGLLTLTDGGQLTDRGGTITVHGSIDMPDNGILFSASGSGPLNIDGGRVEVGPSSSLIGITKVNVGVGGGSGGTLSISGANTSVSGEVSLNNGLLRVTSGSFAIGSGLGGGPVVLDGKTYNIIIGNGGLLDGNGFILGDVLVISGGAQSGVFHPGHSPGVITITGNYAQGMGGVLLLSVGPNSYSQLAVSGSVDLSGGTIQLDSYQGGDLKVGQQYAFIQAAGGITGQPSQVITPEGFTVVTPSIVGGTLMLTATHVANSFAAAATTPNQRAVAAALDAGGTQLIPGILPLVDAVSGLAPASLPATFEQMSPEGLAAGQNAAFLAQHGFDMSLARAAAAPGLPGAAPLSASVAGDGRLWFQGFDAGGRFSANAGAGLAAARTDGGGFTLGLDHKLGPNGLIGVAAGASSTAFAVPGRTASGRVAGAHLGVFGTWSGGPLYASGQFTYTRFHDTTRRLATAAGFSGALDGDAVADAFGGRLEVGWRIDGAVYSAAPYVAVEGVRLMERGFTETATGSAQPLALTLPAQDAGSAVLSVGVKASARWTLGPLALTPSLDVAYGRELVDRRSLTAAFSSAPTLTFLVDGAAPGRDSVHVGLGLDARLSDRVALFAQLETDQARRSHANAAYFGLRMNW
jgi:T5SS/PEP-CTERM-associated repeat protein